MLIKMSEFFEKLEPKKCTECQQKIEEQHECYGNTCENCIQLH